MQFTTFPFLKKADIMLVCCKTSVAQVNTFAHQQQSEKKIGSVCTEVLVMWDHRQNSIYCEFCRSNSQTLLLLWGREQTYFSKAQAVFSFQTTKYICNQIKSNHIFNLKSYMQSICYFGERILRTLLWE